MVTRTTALTVAFVLVSLSSVVAVASVAGASPPVAGTDAPVDSQLADTPSVVDQCAAEPPADLSDPEGDTAEVVGWVEGYWYDEPLDIDASNGLNETELAQLSARTAARFEAMRCLTVQDGLPPVDIVPREEFADSQQSRTVATETRLVDNAKFETTLTIDSQTDSVDVRQSDSASRVGGFYDFVAEEIVIVSDDPSALSIDESVLAEELGHAIQDQHFDIGSYERATVDRDKGILGLIEGDVGFVVDGYLDACESGEWAEPCLTDEGGNGSTDVANWGVYFEQIQPYSDGPSFIQEKREQGGWDAVNSLYDDPPTSALHTVYPDTLGAVEPRDIEVPDRSTDEWDRVVVENAPTADGPLTHDTLGISTITGMFAAPAFEEGTEGQVLPQSATINVEPSGGIDGFNPHEFAHPETEGWRGDSLYTYTNDNDETATVWELGWASPADAGTFVEAYEQLVDIRGGELVDGYTHTYTFDNETGYDVALTIVPDGDRVTVVTGPTVDSLTAVDQQLELLSEDDGDTPGGSGDDSGGSNGGDTPGGSGDDSGGNNGGDTPGGSGDDSGGSNDGDTPGGSGDDSGGSNDGDTPGGVGDDSGGDSSEDGGDNPDEGTDESELGIVVLPAIGMAFLIVLALLTTGTQRKRGR